MKQTRTRFAPAALLLAAAALPFTPLAAQDTQPAPPPPAAQQPPAPPVADLPAPQPPAAAPAPAPAPVAVAPAPAPATAAATVPTPRAAPVRTARPAPRPAPRAVAPAHVAASATTTTTTTTAPTAVAVTPPPATVAPTTVPETVPAAPSTGVDTVPPPAPRQQQPSLNQRTATWPWLVLGALLIAGAALLFARRRRVRDDVYEEAYVPEAEPVAVAPAVAAAEPAGAPEIGLAMRPVRAGVAGDDARVEFELTVDNRGSAPARDVRVSTWMLAAGSTEAEQALIEPRGAADTPPVTLGAGEARTVEAQVALPTSEIAGDSVLPVVVADARYLLPDGSEGHATARFAVGVPDGEELAHFATDNPSGLHEGVVAQALGETERA
jgi:hypothetical protein